MHIGLSASCMVPHVVTQVPYGVGIIFSIEKPGFREVKLVPKHATAGRRLNQERNLGSLDSKWALALLYPDTPPMHSLMWSLKWRAYCEGVWHPATSPWKESAWGLHLAGDVAMGLLQPRPLTGSILLPSALSNTWTWAPARSGVFSVLIPNYSLRLISCLTSQPTPLPLSPWSYGRIILWWPQKSPRTWHSAPFLLHPPLAASCITIQPFPPVVLPWRVKWDNLH